jgi:translation initiation factor RLI1
MPGKIALVNFQKCHPASCANGICAAVRVCRYKLLKQEKAYDVPITDPFICRGCGDCVRACLQKAIVIADN